MSNVEEFPIHARRLTEYDTIVGAGQGVLEAMPGAVYIVDHEGWLVRYNTEAAVLWGRTPIADGRSERFCGSLRLHLPDGTPLSHEDCPMAKAVATGAITRNTEVIIERPDGSRITALVNIRPLTDRAGKIQGAINCFQDITPRKALEAEFRKKQADLEDFFENAAIGLHIVSGAGIILRANKAELDLLGYEASEYVGHHVAEFHADAPVVGDILHRLSCGESLQRYPARLRAKDGSIKHVLITSNSRFKNGEFISTRCFTTDVTGLRDAQDAHRESEDRLAATYEAATIGIAEADEEGRLLRVNDALCKMLGRSREELLSMTFFDYTAETDRETDKAQYAKQVGGALQNYRLRKRAAKPNGTPVYLDVYSSSVRDQLGSFRYGVRVLVDVTEAKLADDRLRDRERHMRELLEALPAAVYTTDAEGRIMFYNKAAIEMAGRIPQAGEQWCVTWRLYNKDGTPLPHDECPMAKALKEDRIIRGAEAIAERPDGTRVPFIPYPTPLHDADGNLIGAINMLVDISERKKAEEYAQRLAAIVEYSDDAIISKDTEGVIRTWNKGAESLFGYDSSEAIGRQVSMLFPPDRDNEEPMILGRIKRGEHVEHYETVRRRKDGTLIDVSLTVSPLKDDMGRIVGASKIARDITERRRHEERRDLLINELNHRVKNTLATVQSLAAQSFREERLNPAYSKFEGRLIALARAHDVLTQESWVGINLHSLIGQTIASICLEPAKRFAVSGPLLKLQPSPALAMAMAFHELCTNAAKYGALSNEEGRINIVWDVEGGSLTPRLRLRWEETGGPTVEEPRQRGFGTRLLERVLCHELAGNARLSFPNSGVVFEIDAPLP